MSQLPTSGWPFFPWNRRNRAEVPPSLNLMLLYCRPLHSIAWDAISSLLLRTDFKKRNSILYLDDNAHSPLWNSDFTDIKGCELEDAWANLDLGRCNIPINQLNHVPTNTAFIDITVAGANILLSWLMHSVLLSRTLLLLCLPHAWGKWLHGGTKTSTIYVKNYEPQRGTLRKTHAITRYTKHQVSRQSSKMILGKPKQSRGKPSAPRSSTKTHSKPRSPRGTTQIYEWITTEGGWTNSKSTILKTLADKFFPKLFLPSNSESRQVTDCVTCSKSPFSHEWRLPNSNSNRTGPCRTIPEEEEGHDSTTAEHIQLLYGELRPHLFNTFDACLKLAYFRNKWKSAQVLTIPKQNKEDYTDPWAHRPISLLPMLGKCLEKFILGRLQHFATWHNWMSSKQHGFQTGLSTITAIDSIKKASNRDSNQGPTLHASC